MGSLLSMTFPHSVKAKEVESKKIEMQKDEDSGISEANPKANGPSSTIKDEDNEDDGGEEEDIGC